MVGARGFEPPTPRSRTNAQLTELVEKLKTSAKHKYQHTTQPAEWPAVYPA